MTDPATRYDFLVDGRRVAARRSGSGEVNLVRSLKNGRHNVALRLTDKAGNERFISRTFKIAIRQLRVGARVISEPNQPEQLVEITGSPGARMLLQRGGKVLQRLTLAGGKDVLSLGLDDGTYSGLVVTLVDAVGRRGTARLPAIVVDTTRPELRIAALKSRVEDGLAAWVVRGESNAAFSWRILDSDESIVDQGIGTLTDRDADLESDVAEGEYRVEVTARDAAGNETNRDLVMTVPADPMTPGAVAAALGVLITLLLLFVFLVWVLWRSRHRIAAWRERQRIRAAQRAADVAYAAKLAAHRAKVATYEHAMRRHQELDTAWETRLKHLRHLRELAQNDYGSTTPSFQNVKLRKGERVLTTVQGALVDTRTRQGTSYLDVTDAGRITITSARVVFNGRKKREWAFDKLENREHIGPTRTLMKVSNRKARSSVDYADGETTRLYLDLAFADLRGSRVEVVDDIGRRLHEHEQARPEPPRPVGPPPTRSVPKTAGTLR